mmetsp:Transcript_13725/g.41474  ORF Transcript_13725/g.41474 Transcript_13725/m.41474 type:complete len:352 (-) Transcript_13725:499-1554(-)
MPQRPQMAVLWAAAAAGVEKSPDRTSRCLFCRALQCPPMLCLQPLSLPSTAECPSSWLAGAMADIQRQSRMPACCYPLAGPVPPHRQLLQLPHPPVLYPEAVAAVGRSFVLIQMPASSRKCLASAPQLQHQLHAEQRVLEPRRWRHPPQLLLQRRQRERRGCHRLLQLQDPPTPQLAGGGWAVQYSRRSDAVQVWGSKPLRPTPSPLAWVTECRVTFQGAGAPSYATPGGCCRKATSERQQQRLKQPPAEKLRLPPSKRQPFGLAPPHPGRRRPSRRRRCHHRHRRHHFHCRCFRCRQRRCVSCDWTSCCAPATAGEAVPQMRRAHPSCRRCHCLHWSRAPGLVCRRSQKV